MKWLRDTKHPVYLLDDGKFPYQNSLFVIDKINPQSKILFSLKAEPELLSYNSKACRTFMDKSLSRQFFNKYYPIQYKVLLEDTTFENCIVFDNIDKVVAKPLNGIASQGVMIINKNEFSSITIPKDYIIEEYIEGKEIAVDGFYKEGELHILNINEHIFSNEKDVSDTLYITADFINEQYKYGVISAFEDMKLWCEIPHQFPFHAEFKVTKDEKYFPIEINPYRFSGYGTCELMWYAYNINPYELFFENKETYIPSKNGTIGLYGFVDIMRNNSRSDEDILQMFSEVLEYRILPPECDVRAIVFFRETKYQNLKKFARINNNEERKEDNNP